MKSGKEKLVKQKLLKLQIESKENAKQTLEQSAKPRLESLESRTRKISLYCLTFNNSALTQIRKDFCFNNRLMTHNGTEHKQSTVEC